MAEPIRRRRRDRARTEADLLAAARRLIRRDGVLSGLNLNEVADEAGVNRGQIYQIYGSRKALLRAALAEALGRLAARRPNHWERDFAERRRAMMRLGIDEEASLHMLTLLVLDGDEDAHPMPAFELTKAALARDKETGALPADADGEALHVLTSAACAGYVIFRRALARDTGIPLAELDRRVFAAYDQMVDRIVTP